MMLTKQTKGLIGAIILGAVGVAVILFWQGWQPSGLGPGFAAGNGRIEAREIDVATKLPGRLAELMADEGDFVTEGQVLARMDTDVLDAQLSEAKAQVRRAEHAESTAVAMVALKESERATALAVVAQREAELTAAERRLARTEPLARQGIASQDELDDDRAAMLSAKAALAAARSQVASTVAGIEAAKSQVVEAHSAVEAAVAVTKRIEADLEDSLLKAPRDGRVQYRVAEVGEILPGGGKVLNMVDLNDVYMTFFLPTLQAGRVELGHEVRLVLDAAPEYVIPAKVSYVASVAQFTPKSVETASEREKLMFRVKAQISPELLKEYVTYVKTGLPGMAYLRLDPKIEWPDELQIKVPT
jgi:HlyD family secretion protein